ncbi:unnamed protein product [Rotaria magnacalcarata]|uniref:Histamine H1 receptor n=3 Tax=Rotaria magnacalcarata TaxID=392030 RepID=A0A816N2L8_9BILA|nr:unnamed protein product [Rotaria magnacalcarata]CAF2027562.1 unnamed protein product [Rotaria magnacalcarata]CAF4183831.1 unnamed protein product [Rotaria magnacalcarata]CAF4263209.1 unnamed protein product [Rotaria magnacalcarata]
MMIDIIRFPISEEHEQYEVTYGFENIYVHSFNIDNMSEINLTNLKSQDFSNNSFDLISNFKYTTLTYKFGLGFIFICLCLLTMTGNLLVLITFRRIRTVGNLFILSLATADLIVGCFVMPIAGIYAITEKWNMGLVLCQMWLSVDYTASTASIFNLLTLSLDRYWSITSPLQYLGKRTRPRALLLIGFAWGLSLLWVIPIVGWHRFVNHGVRYIDSTKCEPEYTHSKVFKVSTAIINFYFPLFVLISLNARIYYEIKRRYKSVLLQRHSNQINEPSSYHKLNSITRYSRGALTMALCDSDKQLCSTPLTVTDNDNLNASKRSSIKNETNPALRINFREKKLRSIISNQISDSQRSSLKRAYSCVEKNSYTQDRFPCYVDRNEHLRSHSPIRSKPSPLKLRPGRTSVKHRLNVDERCLKHTHDYHSCRLHSNDRIGIMNKRHQNSSKIAYRSKSHSLTNQSTFICRRCSLSDTMRTSTTMNIFNLCNCCSAATSAVTIHSNIEQPTNTKISSSSLSSVASRRQNTISSFALQRNSISSNLLLRSSSLMNRRASSKIKQSTVWNQQEKAFRQLFAIVFGFTCCFLPYFILYMVVAFCGSCVSERFVTTSIWLGYVNSTINPFLYALSNKHFRRTFHRILKRDQRRQSYYN